jgi:hypothetical protein
MLNDTLGWPCAEKPGGISLLVRRRCVSADFGAEELAGAVVTTELVVAVAL